MAFDPVPVAREDLARLAAWAPRLASLQSAGRWQGGDEDANGVIHMPWFELGPEIVRFTREVAEAGFVRPVDWMAWAGTADARALIEDPRLIARASPTELVYLLTTIVRGERFGDGEIEAAFERGSLLAIARRAEALLRET